ncbi:MAG: hypothetical protein Q4B84_01525, partial [Clostridia bacterium]|nr:hypothetical protein [Clostridia bacterium]
MRTKNSFINIAVSFMSYAIIMVGSFVVRKILSQGSGLEIVGLTETFTDVISGISIIELGLGIGIVYKLYKPIVEKDWEQISVVLCFVKKCYRIILLSIIILGFLSVYFVVSPIESELSKLYLAKIFILYIIDSVASYFYYYKRVMFIADQKNYVNNVAHLIAQIIMIVFQIIVLKLSIPFEAYVICTIGSKLIENFIISYNFDRRYKNINLNTTNRMQEIEKKDVFVKMRA